MSIVGFDFGSQNSRIAVIRSGGVDVICNEVSDRATPSMVSFDSKRRFAGDASKTQQVGNFRNTVSNLPRLIGRLSTETCASTVEAKYETCALQDKDGMIAATVSYKNEQKIFSSVELTAMFLNKLKAITHAETKATVSDVVISVPSYFTEKERKALIDAAEIAGLNCLRTVNDITAAAVNYGMMKTDIPEDNPKNIIILDIGYSSLKACVASFIKGQVEIKSHVSEMNLGGRDFDEVLVHYFAEHFLKLRKVDIRENKKALLRLRVACERIKKVLSGIQLTRMELEALIDGADFPLEMSRQVFEEFSLPLVDRIELQLREVVRKSGLSLENIDSVEIIGGTTRIPAIKSRIAQLFGKEACTTLNADESVSRGCALICAMDSPLVKVREYKILDRANYSFGVKISSQKACLAEFIIPSSTPTNQICNFQMDFSAEYGHQINAEVFYSDLTELSSQEIPRIISKYILSLPSGFNIPTGAKLDLFASITGSGLFDLSKASLSYEEEVSVSSASSPSSESSEQSEESKNEQDGVKTKVVSVNFGIKAETSRIPKPILAKLKDAEINMSLNDKLVAETDDRRNAVEEYIYEARSKLEDSYDSIATEEEKESIRAALTQAEDWLYGDGADLSKEAYIKKLDELKDLFKPLSARLLEQAKAAASPRNEESSPNETTSPHEMDMD